MACEQMTDEQWGHETFRQGFCKLIETVLDDFNLTYTGWRHLRGVFLSRLLNRLAIHDHLQSSPEILNEPIVSPLFVTGLPRTGSTMLQRLLALDPHSRCLVFWQACHPAPLPAPEEYAKDPRFGEAQRFIRWLHRMAPHYNSIHPMHPTFPEECTLLLMNTFVSQSFRLYGPVRAYSNWYSTVDRRPSYQDYRRQLQMLQYGDHTRRWILKAPAHMRSLDALLSVFPDACIVQTHRDPLKVLPSACSLLATMNGVLSDHVDPVEIGRRILRSGPKLVSEGDHVRRSADPARFCDIHFTELMQDPISCVRRIYSHFNLPYTDLFERRMQQWLVENRREKHGRHRYQLEQFGLDPREIRERFAEYYQRHDIQPDGAPAKKAAA